eukprot:13646210-Heterocapsa_arctica.AAC.1
MTASLRSPERVVSACRGEASCARVAVFSRLRGCCGSSVVCGMRARGCLGGLRGSSCGWLGSGARRV